MFHHSAHSWARFALAAVLLCALALVVAPSAFAASEIYVRVAGDDVNCNGTADVDYSAGVVPNCAVATIQTGVDLVDAGGTVHVRAGTYVLTAVVNLNKAGITLDGAGAGSTVVQVSGTGDRFDISAAGVTLQDFEIEKTDKTGLQEIIRLRASDITVKNNTIHGRFVIGDGEVSRAMVFNAGAFSGLNIEGNTIYALRQPAYISGTHTGTIKNNYVYGTKGWVLEGGNLTFTGNTWGTGAQANVYDVAIIPSMPAGYYTDIVAMSNANNGAVIEDQRVSPAVLSVAYVDATTSFSTDLGGRYHPYSSITPAIARVVTGGTIKVLPGTYEEQVVIDGKNLTLQGESLGAVIKAPASVPACFTTSNDKKPVVCVKNAAVTLDTLTVDGAGRGNANYSFMGVAFRNAAGTLKNSVVKDIRDTPFSGAQHGVAVYAYNDDGTSRTINVWDNTITGFQKNGMALSAGDTTPLVLDVHGNVVAGAGTTTTTAQNGIQVSARLGTGSVSGNTVTGIAYDAPSWVATAILDFYSAVTISDNTLSGCHTCIYKIEASGEISGNTVNAIKAGGVSYGIVASDPPTAKPSPVTEEVAGSVAGVAASTASTLSVSVDDNQVSFSGVDNTSTYGIEVDSGYSPNDIAFSATGNTVSGFSVGVELYKCESSCNTGVLASAAVSHNKLGGNTLGVRSNHGSPVVNAEGNYWGSITGPGPLGTGSAVDGAVDYQPWCNEDFSVCTYQVATLALTALDAVFCGGSTTVSIGLSNITSLWGYQFEVNYDSTKASATGAFVDTFFNTSGQYKAWNADCTTTPGKCKFAVTRTGGSPVNGTGVLATVTFTDLAPGNLNVTLTGDVLSDIDGTALTHTVSAAPTITVCGLTSVSGTISLQGRATPHTIGPVTLTGPFGPYTADFSATTGAWTISGVKVMPAGSTYTLNANHTLYLANEKSVSLMPSTPSTGHNTKLLGGDANNDEAVSMADLSCIGGSFGLPPAGSCAGGSSDINDDGLINIQDLSIAGGNYNKVGPLAW